MRSLWRSPQLADYGSLLILLLLCDYYSVATLGRQYPITPAAGKAVANRIADEHGPDAYVLIVVRPTEQDRRFAEAISQGLNDRKHYVHEIVTGDPRIVRETLVRRGKAEKHGRSSGHASARIVVGTAARGRTCSPWGANTLRWQMFKSISRRVIFGRRF